MQMTIITSEVYREECKQPLFPLFSLEKTVDRYFAVNRNDTSDSIRLCPPDERSLHEIETVDFHRPRSYCRRVKESRSSPSCQFGSEIIMLVGRL